MGTQLRAVFDIFDLDGSGAISIEELRQVLCNPDRERGQMSSTTFNAAMDVMPDGKTIEEVMIALDTNSNGQVEYHEFEQYLLAEHAESGRRLCNAAPMSGAARPLSPPPGPQPGLSPATTQIIAQCELEF